jgi:hypothetical protein
LECVQTLIIDPDQRNVRRRGKVVLPEKILKRIITVYEEMGRTRKKSLKSWDEKEQKGEEKRDPQDRDRMTEISERKRLHTSSLPELHIFLKKTRRKSLVVSGSYRRIST